MFNSHYIMQEEFCHSLFISHYQNPQTVIKVNFEDDIGYKLNFVGRIRKKSSLSENVICLHEGSNFPLIVKKPIFFTVFREEDGCFAIKEHLFNLYVFANSKDELEKELKYDLMFLWQKYASHPDDDLTLKALELKKNLLIFFKERE